MKSFLECLPPDMDPKDRAFMIRTHKQMCGDELYDALKALIVEVEVRDNPIDMGVRSHDDTMIAARAAIAKAEGR